jgi:hypothetical protein
MKRSCAFGQFKSEQYGSHLPGHSGLGVLMFFLMQQHFISGLTAGAESD